MIIQLLLVLLSSSINLARSDSDGCWTAFTPVIVQTVQGSTGYSVVCSASSADSASFAVSHKGRPFRVHHSFLETDKRSSTDQFDICFAASDSASSSDAVYAQFSLSGQYVIRGAVFADSPIASLATPESYSFNVLPSASSTSSKWYVSQKDADSASSWSLLVGGSVTNRFDSDVVAKTIKIFPSFSTASADSNGFGVSFYGCPVENTALVSFKFQSSKSAITARFGTVSGFITQLTQYVCLVAKLVPTPTTCAQMVYADMVESSSANPNATSSLPLQPTSLPSLEVFYRVLPPNASTCTDCRVPDVIQSDLVTELNNPVSAGSAIMNAIDVWIQDSDPYTCYAKQCAAGTLCVNGVCVTPGELAATQATQISLQSAVNFSNTNFDSILNLAPLSVIEGIDQTAGLITFASTATPVGNVAIGDSSAATAAPSTTSDSSPTKRFFIPIVVVSSVAAVIIALLAWRMYKYVFFFFLKFLFLDATT